MDSKARELLVKYGKNNCTSEEKALVEQFYMQQWSDGDLPLDKENIKAEIWNQIQQEKDSYTNTPYVSKRKRTYLLQMAAAAIILLIGIVSYFSLYRPTEIPQQSVEARDSITPGGNKATLILGDGRRIALSDHHQGIVIGDSIHYEDGQYVGSVGADQLLTVTTPAGGQYQITLPDGTAVWLNAASTITYPARFAATERRVQLEGEAYFDVTTQHRDGSAQHSSIPFRVVSKAQTVEVLGTQFNISAYTDDPNTVTTLVEGSVSIARQNGKTILKPGQQAVVNDRRTAVQSVDVAQYTDWKAGHFNFADEELESILRKVSRWYNVSIQYKDTSVKEYTYLAVLPRYAQISELLDVLEETGNVTFQTKGRHIIVKRKK